MRTLIWMMFFPCLGVCLALAGEEALVPDSPLLPQKDKAVQVEKSERAVNDERFHSILKAAAEQYKGYKRFDDGLAKALAGCGPSPHLGPQTLHGDKIKPSENNPVVIPKVYMLYAYDIDAYKNEGKQPEHKKKEPVELDGKQAQQIVVKESWIPEIDEKKNEYVAKKNDLFVILKLDEKTEGTDKGWVYGVLSSDGKVVKSAGRVQNCMACHQNAGAGRLFGLSNRRLVKEPIRLLEDKSVDPPKDMKDAKEK
ncbi:MAG: cytochrome P460 family protein [Planctomycetes bacterium]|nr:cytochrome P460 family protein [Planctomycetota bacterium]